MLSTAGSSQIPPAMPPRMSPRLSSDSASTTSSFTESTELPECVVYLLLPRSTHIRLPSYASMEGASYPPPYASSSSTHTAYLVPYPPPTHVFSLLTHNVQLSILPPPLRPRHILLLRMGALNKHHVPQPARVRGPLRLRRPRTTLQNHRLHQP